MTGLKPHAKLPDSERNDETHHYHTMFRITPTNYERQLENKPLQREMTPAIVTIWERLDHLTWAWFTWPMATGGIALLLSGQPHTFPGIMTIGKVVYIFDLLIWLTLSILITRRFVRNPAKLKASLTHATEGLLFPAFLLCFPTIISGMIRYGVPSTGPWLVTVVEVLFWAYIAIAFSQAVWQYLYLFSARQLTIQSMTPAWLLPIFPIMLSGTIASALAPALSTQRRLPVLVAGATFQGLGFWIAILMYSTWIVRLMQCGLPVAALRPGMFIAVGPPSFTSLALIGMSRVLPADHSFFINHPSAIDTLQTMALAFSIFIWSSALWFFAVSTVSCLAAIPKLEFHLVWYAFVFPNVGFIIAIINIGIQFESEAIMWIGSVLTVLLIAFWLFVMVMHVRAVIRGDILWPGRDEDKDE